MNRETLQKAIKMSLRPKRLKYNILGESNSITEMDIAPKRPNLCLKKYGSPTNKDPTMAYITLATKSVSPNKLIANATNSIWRGPCIQGE